MSKSNVTLCDICKKPIKKRKCVLLSERFSQYTVKIIRIEEGASLAGTFRKKQILDVCPKCMDKFVEFVSEQAEQALEGFERRC